MRISPIVSAQYSTLIRGDLPFAKTSYIIIPVEDKQVTDVPLETFQAYGMNFTGYDCELKRLYKRGLLKIKYSFYGGKLNPRKTSIEHIVPRSKGGRSWQSNYVLCNSEQNNRRGNSPLLHYINWEAVGIYLKQFEGVRVKNFDGDKYIKDVVAAIDEAIHNNY